MKSFSLASLFALALAGCGGIIADDLTSPPPSDDASPPDVVTPVADAAPDAASPDACLPAMQDCSDAAAEAAAMETICRVFNPITGGLVGDYECAPDMAWNWYSAKYPEQAPPALTCAGATACPPHDTCVLPDGTVGACILKAK